jgi:hypothetical protein
MNVAETRESGGVVKSHASRVREAREGARHEQTARLALFFVEWWAVAG